MQKDLKILKNLLKTASLAAVSAIIPITQIYAAPQVVQMLGDVALNDPSTNFNSPFVEGDTIEVNSGGQIYVAGIDNIGAIRANQDASILLDRGDARLELGSIAGTGMVKLTLIRNATGIPSASLNGHAGVNNIPAENDYSALAQISYSTQSITSLISLNINSPITLHCTVNTNNASGIVNINNNVTLNNTINATAGGDIYINLAQDISLIVSADDALQDGTNTGRVIFDFMGTDSVLNINGNDTTIRGAITNGANGTLHINAGVTTATDSTITTIQETNIADNTTFNIDNVYNNIDLLDNGTNIVFKGVNSELDLVNTSNTDDRTCTLYANLNPSNVEDEYGVVRVGAITNALTVANNGGLYTIGQDNTHRLKGFTVDGAGDIVVYNTVFTKQFNINSTGQVTLNQPLDLGTGGNIAFGADGTLVANKGVIGNITFNDAGTLVTTGVSGNIDCIGQAATINFSGNDDYILNNPIQNGESATLDVNLPKLTVTDLVVGSINISDNKILAIDLADGDKTLLAPGEDGIKFLGHNSTFQVENTSINEARIVSFASNLAGDAGGGGILLLSGGVKGLTITGDNASTTIGVPGNEISTIETQGIVTMQNSIDASSVSALNIVLGSNFTDQSCTTAQVLDINIGSTSPTTYLNRLHETRVLNDLAISKATLSKVGSVRTSSPSAIYVLDIGNADDANLDFLIPNQTINFIDANATLKLLNTGDSDHSVILLQDLDSGQDTFGRVELSAGADTTLTIKGGSLGTATHKLKQLELSGDGLLIIQSGINTTDLELNVPVITLVDVHSNLSFATNTILTETGNIDGSIDFQNNAAIINMAANQTITGNVNSTGGNNGTINFAGTGTIDGVVTNIAMIKAGAGDVVFQAPGGYSLGEIQGNGDGTITFPPNVNFTGGINITGGESLSLSFANNTNINGNIGSNSNPIGNITSNDNTEFNGDIISNGDITTLGTTLFVSDVACNNILANKTSSNTLSFATLIPAFTTNGSSTINFDQSNVITTFQGKVDTKGSIEVNGSTYFADTVNSQGNVTINGDTKFNKTLSSNNDILVSSGSNVIFNGSVNASNVNIGNANIMVSDNISVHGNISANNSSIILDNNTLTLSSTTILSNQITISSTYDESSLSGGKIVLTSGSTLDLSSVSELTVKLSFINSDISQINDGTKYNVILAEDGSNIILLNDPEKQIILDSSGEQNKFVRWTIDPKSLTLYASDISTEIIDEELAFGSLQNQEFAEQLKNASPGSEAQAFKNNIGLLSKEQVEEMFARIIDHPKERSIEIVRIALHHTLTDTHRSAMNAIHNRLNHGPAVVSAGGDDISRYDSADKYGAWVRSSINHSKDKVSRRQSEYFSSYKTRGHSNTIGFDSLVCENLLFGAAYTNSYTSIKSQDQNIGNIDKVRTNMFSLYSSYNIPNYNWYLASTISYAESSIREKKIRNLAIAKNVLDSEVASSKYKSYLYSGGVSLGYNHHINNNIYIAPSLGATGSLIRDKGYTETGTSFQNLAVRKKNYNKLSGTAGLRAYQNIYLDNLVNIDSVIVTPEAYGLVNYNTKNTTPATDARLQGIDDRLPTINYKSNRVDYNLGLGITVKHKMMEYGINYDANLAKKYQGHSGSLKVRVNL